MKVGDRARFFCVTTGWLTTGDIDDNDCYFLPATVVSVRQTWNGEVADIRWDHQPDRISEGHYTFTIREVAS